jgi:hypothetical protein
MTSENSYTPIPLPVLASLRNLTGDEFKLMGCLCYQTYNRQTPQLTIEQIQAFSGISSDRIKPALHRLIRLGWIHCDGAVYHLALQHSQPQTTEPQPIQYDTLLGIRPPRPKPHLLYPEGPWLTENGLLNQDFVHDRAQVWRTGNHPQSKAFGEMAIEDVMGIVCKHYAKPANHANLEIDWQSYCLKNQRYLTNVQQRLQSGAAIEATEQAVVLSKLPALIQEMQPIYEPVTPVALPKATQLPLLETDLTVPKTFAEVQAASRALVSQKTMPSAKRDRRPTSTLEKIRLWLSDNVLRPEAERLARAQGYDLVYDETGRAIDVVLNA